MKGGSGKVDIQLPQPLMVQLRGTFHTFSRKVPSDPSVHSYNQLIRAPFISLPPALPHCLLPLLPEKIFFKYFFSPTFPPLSWDYKDMNLELLLSHRSLRLG